MLSGPTPANGSDNSPLRAAKGTMYEGEIRVPFMIQGKMEAGQSRQWQRAFRAFFGQGKTRRPESAVTEIQPVIAPEFS